MKVPHQESVPVIPRGALVGAAIMVTLTICGAAWARYTGYTTTNSMDLTVVSTLELRFADREDGAIVIREGVPGDGAETLVVLPPGDDGFVRGVLRALARQRQLTEHDQSAPLALTRWSDGRLSIGDPISGSIVWVNAFGPDNAGDFERILEAVRTAEGTASARPVIIREENEA